MDGGAEGRLKRYTPDKRGMQALQRSQCRGKAKVSCMGSTMGFTHETPKKTPLNAQGQRTFAKVAPACTGNAR